MGLTYLGFKRKCNALYSEVVAMYIFIYSWEFILVLYRWYLRSFKERFIEVVHVCSLSSTPIVSYTEVSTVIWEISSVSTTSTLTCQPVTSTRKESLSINCSLCTCTTFTWTPFPSNTVGNLNLKEKESLHTFRLYHCCNGLAIYNIIIWSRSPSHTRKVTSYDCIGLHTEVQVSTGFILLRATGPRWYKKRRDRTEVCNQLSCIYHGLWCYSYTI